MNVAELSHRLLEAMQYSLDALYFKNGWRDKSVPFNVDALDEDLGVDLSNNNEKLNNYFKAEYKEICLSFDNSKFFKSVVLDESFDIRAYWESQRFNELILLSLEGSTNVRLRLESWMESNPPLRGINYISTMECAIRCINLYAALCILKKKGQLDDKLLYLSNQFFDANFRLIKNRISKFSSRGNHTLFEYAGLVVCARFVAPQKQNYWVDKCLNEFDFQTLDDGAGVEQSTAYHLFNVEVTWLIQHYLTNGTTKAAKLSSALSFCADFWLKNRLVRVGDSDSSILFSRVMIDDELIALKQSLKLTNTYPDTGIVSTLNQDLHVYFKYGSLGLAPLFGHGHYDFLSLILVDSSGNNITADAQTYLYNTCKRNEYRSSEYHSMPVVGLDDIKQISKFSWANNASGELESVNNGWLSGYYKRTDGSVIRRKFKLLVDKLIVVDQLIEVKISTSLVTQWLILNKIDSFKFYVMDENNAITELAGSTDKLDGSFEYSVLKKNAITRLKLTSKPTEKIITIFNLTDDTANCTLSAIAKDLNGYN